MFSIKKITAIFLLYMLSFSFIIPIFNIWIIGKVSATSLITWLNENPIITSTWNYFVNIWDTFITNITSIDNDNVVIEFWNTTLSSSSALDISHSEFCNPIVLATVKWENNWEVQRAPRILSKSSTGFTFKADNYYWTPPDITDIAYLVVESWSYDIWSMHIQAWSQYTEYVYSKDNPITNGTPVYFYPNFSSKPAVIHNIASNNHNTWVVSSVNWNDNSRTSEPTNSEMSVFLQRSFASNVHDGENIDYLAVDPWHYNIEWIEIDARQSSDSIQWSNSVWYDVDFLEEFSLVPETFFTSQLWEDWWHWGYAQYHSWWTATTTSFPAVIDEDGPSADRAHTTEVVWALVFSTGSWKLTIPNVLTYSIVWWDDASEFQIDSSWALNFVSWKDGDNPDDANLDAIYEVEVQVCDSHCNQKCSTKIINIEVDKKPIITLNWSWVIDIVHWETYTDAWAVCNDEHDWTCSVISSWTVDTNVLWTYIIEYNATDSNWNSADTVTRTVNVINNPPTDISLSETSIDENNNIFDLIWVFTTLDLDTWDIHTYSFTWAWNDNTSFTLSWAELLAWAEFDYETKSSYTIRILTDDGYWWTFEKDFTININNINLAPTDIILTWTWIDENNSIWEIIWNLSWIDDWENNNTLTYTLACDTPWVDDASFSISWNELKAWEEFDYETKSSYDICIKISDGVKTFDKDFTIIINDLDEIPPEITITAPTKIKNSDITDTTITITDNIWVNVSDISASLWTISCTQTSVIQVDCSIIIPESWDLVIIVLDTSSNLATKTEANYIIDTIPPSTPNVNIDTSDWVNTPDILFYSFDNVAIDYYELEYYADDWNSWTGIFTLINPATSPVSLILDSDEMPHIIKITVYDTAGNSSYSIVKFPPIINFTAPTTLSNTTINDSTVTITTPSWNDLENITLIANWTQASLWNCTGSGSDITEPYATPVVCEIQNIEESWTIQITAEDAWNGAEWLNSQSYIIDKNSPEITITAPTKIKNSDITDTTIIITDNIWVNVSDISTSLWTMSCIQTNPTRVDCTLTISDSWDLVISVTDNAGNNTSEIENNYIIDTTEPVLTLIWNNPEMVEYLDNYVDQKAEYSDNIDWTWTIDWSGAVNTWILWSYTITYNYTDQAWNVATEIVRIVNVVDTIAPEIILNWWDESYSLWEIYVEKWAICIDNLDENCEVIITWIVNTNIIWTYIVTYTSTDSSWNISSKTRKVIVSKPPSSWWWWWWGNISNKSDKILDKCKKDIKNKEDEKKKENDNIKKEWEKEIIIEKEDKTIHKRIINWKNVEYVLKNLRSCEKIPNILSILKLLDKLSAWNFDLLKLTSLKDLNKSILKKEILSLELNNIVHWDEDDNFNPFQDITRAEFLKIVLRSHCYDYSDSNSDDLKYIDLDKNTWQAKVAKKATEIWLIHWYKDWTVRMNYIISKIEAFKILYNLRILNVWEWKIETDNYKDVKIDWEKDLVKNLETLWIINSKFDKNKFHPDSWVNREFMVDYLIKTIKLY